MKLTDQLRETAEIPPAVRGGENPNPAICGWCPKCREWAIRGRQDQCMFCDEQLLDRPGGERL